MKQVNLKELKFCDLFSFKPNYEDLETIRGNCLGPLTTVHWGIFQQICYVPPKHYRSSEDFDLFIVYYWNLEDDRHEHFYITGSSKFYLLENNDSLYQEFYQKGKFAKYLTHEIQWVRNTAKKLLKNGISKT